MTEQTVQGELLPSDARRTRRAQVYSFKQLHYYHIPAPYYDIVSTCHNSRVGHFGVEPTIDLVKLYLEKNIDKYKDLVWHSMRKDITHFIKFCPTCQVNSIHRLRIETKKYTTSKFGVLKNLCIDAIFVPESKSLYKYILVIVCACTRYVQLHPIRDLSAASAATILMSHMYTYGVPVEICTDNASQFQGVFQEMLDLLTIYGYKVQAYSHQENGIVERANQEVLRHLRNVLFDTKVRDEWDKHLKLTESIMNAHINKSTGIAPVDVVFAGQVDLNAGHLFPPMGHPLQQPLSEYMEKVISYQENVLRIIYKNQEETDMFHLAKNLGTSSTDFPINSFVTAAYENEEHRPPTKLHNRRRGPFRVVRKTVREEGDVYTCVDLVTHKEEDFHVKFLSPFNYDSIHTNLLDVATTERNLFIVEEVLNHRWKDPALASKGQKGKTASNLQLYIKWKYYETPEWNEYNEPSIKKVGLVIDYLRSHQLTYLIPYNFRPQKHARSH